MNRGTVLAYGLAGALLIAGSYLYFQKGPCEAPIAFSIGEIDPRFGVSSDTFTADINRAIAIWEKAAGKDLFVYDPDGDLTVSLVYDERQQITQKEQALSADIDQASHVADSVKAQYSALRDEYDAAQEAYATHAATFSAHQASYNRKVEYWNSKGGAPRPEYETLTKEKNDLLAEQAALEAERTKVNGLADSINAYIAKYNLLVASINTNISRINNDGLAGTQFEEGVYISDRDGRRITIYQFEDATDLIRVLAHEFGHALDLDHNDNPDSIMNPVNQSETLALSPEDLAELAAVCS